MHRRTFLSFAASAAVIPALGADPASQGRIETLTNVGAGPGTGSRIRVWLPPRYDETDLAHRVLYMLDGQYAFADDSDGTNFRADQRVERLMATGSIPPTMIVAIDHLGDDRFLQYMPEAIYERGDAGVRATVEREMARLGAASLVAAEFVRFLEARLKPFIDARYRTSGDRLDTAIFGASMAGVMAGALLVEAPRVFGRGACMSPNWAIYDERMLDHPGLASLWAAYFKQLGAPKGRRLWLDHGTEMMDAGMASHQRAIAKSLEDLGWRRGCNLQTRVYDAGHAFAQTATQMDDVLAWLLA